MKDIKQIFHDLYSGTLWNLLVPSVKWRACSTARPPLNLGANRFHKIPHGHEIFVYYIPSMNIHEYSGNVIGQLMIADYKII